MVDVSFSMYQNVQALLSLKPVMKEEPSSDELISHLAQERKLFQEVLDNASTAQFEIATLHSELQQLVEENLNLTTQVNPLRAKALPTEPPVPTEETPIPEKPVDCYKKSECVPDPPGFSGWVKSKLESFLNQLKPKFWNTADRFPTFQCHLVYVVPLYPHTDPTLHQKNRMNLVDLALFYQILENTFCHPDKIATVIQKLDTSDSGTRTFPPSLPSSNASSRNSTGTRTYRNLPCP